MREKLLILSLLMLIVPTVALAQTGTVEGVVIDPDEIPIPGANVALQGTNHGAATDFDGEFSFTAPAGEYTLRVTFIGYAEYTAPITVVSGETLELRVQLEEGAVGLDEIVVTALGMERQERSLGYAFQQVEGDLVQRAQESNLVNALAGKVAGVQVTSSSGQPGKAARITIRGASSFLGNNQPLFVIDGMPISNDEDDNLESNEVFTGGTINRAVDIDPNLIEDITVLKGATAMALYGSRAANGAVIITTKGGRAGANQPMRVTFSSQMRWDEPIIEGLQTEYAQGQFGCFYNGLPPDMGGYVDAVCMAEQRGGVPEDYVNGDPRITRAWGPSIEELNQNERVLNDLGVDQIQAYDPREAFYQTGLVTENNLGISGSALGGSYYLSGTYLSQEGTVPNTLMDRGSVLAKYGANLTPELSVETSINYIRTENDWVNEGNSANAYLFSLNFAPPTFDITQRTTPDGQQLNYNTSLNNPLWLVDHNKYTSDVDRFIGSVKLAYDILPWLTMSEQAGLDTYTDTRKNRIDIGTRGFLNGSMYDQGTQRRQINSDLILQANRRFGRVGLSALIGNQINAQYYNYNFIRGENLGVPGFFNIDNAAVVEGDQYTEERRLFGLYSQATVDYDDWAYLTLTARNDWSSTLPQENNSYFYPSVSGSVVFTEVLDLFDGSPLSFGKVRASWARIGNDADPYSTSTTFVKAGPGDGQRGEIIFPFSGVSGFQLTNVLGNPDLKPELSSEYELGLDVRFFGQRARFDASYYNRTTTDQIFPVPVSAATGFVERLLNAGEINNKGVELLLSLTPIQTRDFAWDIAGNWSKNKAEVVSLTEGVESIYLAGFTSPQIRIMEGEDGYGVIWADRFVYADPEEHADLFAEHPELEEGMLLIDADGFPVIAPDLGPVGNVQPDWLANVRSSLTYKGITLSGLLDIRRGGDVLNFDLFYSSFYGTAEVTADRGSEFVYEGFNIDDGEMNDVSIVRDQAFYQNFFSFYTPNFVEDGSYVKLRELSLSYTFPQRLIARAGLQAATITATGRNLWTRTDFSYGDPEGSLYGSGNGQGFYHMVTPSTRAFSLGVRLTF